MCAHGDLHAGEKDPIGFLFLLDRELFAWVNINSIFIFTPRILRQVHADQDWSEKC